MEMTLKSYFNSSNKTACKFQFKIYMVMNLRYHQEIHLRKSIKETVMSVPVQLIVVKGVES